MTSPYLRQHGSNAEALLRRLRDYVGSREAKAIPELGQRARQLEEELRKRVEILASPRPRIAFVAHKGVGKSTLINALAGLWIDGETPSTDLSAKGLNAQALMPLGTGSTTPCEIVLEAGEWEISVEPLSRTSTEHLLTDFAKWAWDKAHLATDSASSTEDGDKEDDGEEAESTGRTPRLQLDVERVLRGMTALPEEKKATPKDAGGGRRISRLTIHYAVEMAREFPRSPDFVRAVVERAALDTRKRRQWLPEGDERRWLRNTLLDLFNGRFADQPFPGRVVIRAPFEGVTVDGVSVPLVDTLGLPAVGRRTVAGGISHPLADRSDLRELLKDPWTLAVIGSQFNEPPAPATDLLQQMMSEAIHFGEALAHRSVVVIVDKGEAGAGALETDPEVEREKKEDRCAENLLALGCPGPRAANGRWSHAEALERICCVNILGEGGDQLIQFLENAVERMRQAHTDAVAAAIAEAEAFFRGLTGELARALREKIIKEMDLNLIAAGDKVRSQMNALSSNLLNPFADECMELHHSTLRSMVVWRGDGTASARALLESSMTVALGRRLGLLVQALDVKASEMRRREEYGGELARQLVDDELQRRTSAYNEFLLLFTDAFVAAALERLQSAGDLWACCMGEWGAGIRDPKYKTRVASHFRTWGEENSLSLLRAISASDEPMDLTNDAVLLANDPANAISDGLALPGPDGA